MPVGTTIPQDMSQAPHDAAFGLRRQVSRMHRDAGVDRSPEIKTAEHHEQAAKAHRTAAQQHGSYDHVSAKQQVAQAAEKSKAAHR
jgi:hypothetical protein